MSDEKSNREPKSTAAEHGHIHHPLRGLASEGAADAVRLALEGLPGIRSVHVSIGMAIADVTFDKSVVTAEAIRARLRMAGVQRPRSTEEGT